MRISAGHLKGRRLDGPTWDGLRPTSDSLRETLFNVLGPTLDGASVLDAYAGTGAVGLEALSRGAARVTFIERDPRAVTLIRQHVAKCGVDDAAVIIHDDFTRVCAADRHAALGRFDLVFLDPPYDEGMTDRLLALARTVVTDRGRVVIEHSRRAVTPEAAGGLARRRVVTAGDSALSFYAPAASAAP
jgi:16S rRNA (guanine(966)-N(2))-methyltransferase RsmD